MVGKTDKVRFTYDDMAIEMLKEIRIYRVNLCLVISIS